METEVSELKNMVSKPMIEKMKKNINIKILFCIVLFPALINCMQAKKNTVDNDHSIQFKYCFQMPDNAGKLLTVTDSIYIFYCGNYTVYQVPKLFESSKIKVDKFGNVLDEKLVDSGVRYSYMIFRKGDQYGKIFDALTKTRDVKANVDSFLNATLYPTFPFYHPGLITLINTETNKFNDIIIEKYKYKEKKNDSYADTIIYYFDRHLNNVEFSFSKSLDSLKNRKAYRIEFITNALIVNGKETIPKRKTYFEIKRHPYDTAMLKNFVERFKKDE